MSSSNPNNFALFCVSAHHTLPNLFEVRNDNLNTRTIISVAGTSAKPDAAHSFGVKSSRIDRISISTES